MKENYYDAIAAGYEELHRDEQEKKIALVKKYLKVKQTNLLLDVGCGTGITSNFPCDVVGLDPSKKLLERFNAPLAKSVKTICAPAEKMPLPDKKFDVVVSITALQNFDDAERGIKEMCRVGKKNARYAISFLKKSPKKEKLAVLIHKYFVVTKEIEEEKDAIFFGRRKGKI
ncbi:MAG: class I SAM-dependent methyltransferase [Candidatus Woesearchaeota archaeon]|nr:class I SAM-dependent methyltransferase [Candidatus Woesearchaeota archaeon]